MVACTALYLNIIANTLHTDPREVANIFAHNLSDILRGLQSSPFLAHKLKDESSHVVFYMMAVITTSLLQTLNLGKPFNGAPILLLEPIIFTTSCIFHGSTAK